MPNIENMLNVFDSITGSERTSIDQKQILEIKAALVGAFDSEFDSARNSAEIARLAANTGAAVACTIRIYPVRALPVTITT